MDEVIFIPDAADKNLPAYTEWGYNSFGARYGSEYFLASSSNFPCKITSNSGKLNFELRGSVSISELMTLNMSFPFADLSHYTQLVALNGQTIDLADSGSAVTVNQSAVEVSSGTLTFKRAQLLRIDFEQSHIILSGTFELSYQQAGVTHELTDGRFDVSISDVYDPYY
jgi:hypothetical protein